jgi:hypothetical protein
MFKRRVPRISVCAIVLALCGCASGADSIKLASGKSVDVVRVGYQAFQEFGGHPVEYTLTIRYKTTLPLKSDELKSEVTDVWKYFTPVINRQRWDTVKIEPMTFGFMNVSWRGLALVYRRTAVGWTDPWQSPPTEPDWGFGTIPQ